MVTTEIHLTVDRKGLRIENTRVTGAGLLTGIFEQIARDVLDNMLDSFIISQTERLERIEIKPGEIVLHYHVL